MRDGELLLFAALFFCPVLPVLSGAGECRTRTLECYDCDSRKHLYCDHIDRTNLTALRPNTTSCQGCCVKFYHNFPNEKPYVQRSCTENIVINYFMVDHVCMSEGKGRGKMCFCEESFCNAMSQRSPASFLQGFLLALSLGGALS